LKRTLGSIVAALAMIAAFTVTTTTAHAAKKDKDPLVVCKFGCEYKKIQKAVNKAKKGDTINVLPGKYKEGVIVEGRKYDDLTIQGMVQKKNGDFKKAKAKKVVLEGKNAKSPAGLAQNGIEAIDVSGITIKNLTARNFATNGIFIRDSNPTDGDTAKDVDCNDYVVKNTFTSYNRSYGVYAFGCTEGKMLKSVGTGHGDSAFYVGATPPLPNLGWTKLKGLEAYENVQAFSGTNSRKIEITKGTFYNNGSGLVPNTLDSEPYEPSTTGRIHDNDIFWNNYNYYLPNSKVQTISDGLGTIGTPPNELTINFPIAIGVTLFGVTGWEVYENRIFGHFKWGVASFSDAVGNEGDDAVSRDNVIRDNEMSRGGADTNAVDFWVDGSGSGNCFQNNNTSTFDPSDTATTESLYPTCPAPPPPASGTGTSTGDGTQFLELAEYVTTTPPENQQCSWTEHPHPPYKNYQPSMVEPGPNCN
jgi:hypothetical protein